MVEEKREVDVVQELRALHVSLNGKVVPEVDSTCERGAREIERLRSGLHEIASMGGEPFNRQSVRAREIYIGDDKSRANRVLTLTIPDNTSKRH